MRNRLQSTFHSGAGTILVVGACLVLGLTPVVPAQAADGHDEPSGYRGRYPRDSAGHRHAPDRYRSRGVDRRHAERREPGHHRRFNPAHPSYRGSDRRYPEHRARPHRPPADYSHQHHHGPDGRQFVVPRVIPQPYHHAYRPYFRGNYYYDGHRHHHPVYVFPVYGGGGVMYRPYAYCGGELFVGGHVGFRVGGLSVGFGF